MVVKRVIGESIARTVKHQSGKVALLNTAYAEDPTVQVQKNGVNKHAVIGIPDPNVKFVNSHQFWKVPWTELKFANMCLIS